jgi:hypothetical protein
VAFKVNYGLERAERNRAKQAKKEAKAKAKKLPGDEGYVTEAGVDKAPDDAVETENPPAGTSE